ncbi:MAG: hypothetical protein NT090_18195 [Acidobacteria bacterium]|nr:hypothetical protein [Acidobacteriota bacterium]
MPVELPVRPNEAVALADLVFEHLEGRPLTGNARARLAARLAGLKLESIRPYAGSLVRDNVHRSAYYLSVDGLSGPAPVPLLLRVALASAPSSAVFPRALLVGRMRPASGREVVVNAIPFGPRDTASIRTFAETLDRAFLPRPQGAMPAIAVETRHPETALPAAFEAFRQILKNTGVNWASIEGSYEAGLWAAIRAGWREGYSAGAGRIVAAGDADIERNQEAIRDSGGYSRFTIDASRAFQLPGQPPIWSDAEAGLFARPFTVGGVSYAFTPDELARLEVKFGHPLRVTGELYDFIRGTKAESGLGRSFDFELSLEAAETPTTPKELIFCLHCLRTHGRAAQLVSPNLNLDAVAELAGVARHFNATLSVRLSGGEREDTIEAIGRATAGRVNYRIAGEFQASHIVRLASRLRG